MLHCLDINKMKTKKFHTVGTAPKQNNKIDTPKHTNTRPLTFLLGTGTKKWRG